jgi:hypothetical protein
MGGPLQLGRIDPEDAGAPEEAVASAARAGAPHLMRTGVI